MFPVGIFIASLLPFVFVTSADIVPQHAAQSNTCNTTKITLFAAGSAAAASGNFLHHYVNTQSEQVHQQKPSAGIYDLAAELPKAIEIIGCGNDAHRFFTQTKYLRA